MANIMRLGQIFQGRGGLFVLLGIFRTEAKSIEVYKYQGAYQQKFD